MEKTWARLSPQEKRDERFKKWLSPQNVRFASPDAEQGYKRRVQRFIDAISLREPDRVPVSHGGGFFITRAYGVTAERAMYDPEAAVQAVRRFVHDFNFDFDLAPAPAGLSGRALELIDYKLYKWPGHGVASDLGYQYVEAEWMTADEYDLLIQDPSDFWLRTYLPRIFGALAGLRNVSPLVDIIELPITAPILSQYGRPDVQAALQALLDAGRESTKYMEHGAKLSRELLEAGLPRFGGGLVKAPFDTLSDTLRGMKGIMMDMYQRPQKVLEAMERLAPFEIRRGVNSATAAGLAIVTIPLHKGADGFMSQKQFDTFYWPTLKKVVLGLNAEGLVVQLFAEGGYNTRLETIKDLPKGMVIWHFDRSDMARAKEVLGSTACIMGNVPSSLMCSGTPSQVREYCRELIPVAGKGGGFILAPGVGADESRVENVRALIAAAKEFGVYRS